MLACLGNVHVRVQSVFHFLSPSTSIQCLCVRPWLTCIRSQTEGLHFSALVLFGYNYVFGTKKLFWGTVTRLQHPNITLLPFSSYFNHIAWLQHPNIHSKKYANSQVEKFLRSCQVVNRIASSQVSNFCAHDMCKLIFDVTKNMPNVNCTLHISNIVSHHVQLL